APPAAGVRAAQGGDRALRVPRGRQPPLRAGAEGGHRTGRGGRRGRAPHPGAAVPGGLRGAPRPPPRAAGGARPGGLAHRHLRPGLARPAVLSGPRAAGRRPGAAGPTAGREPPEAPRAPRGRRPRGPVRRDDYPELLWQVESETKTSPWSGSAPPSPTWSASTSSSATPGAAP